MFADLNVRKQSVRGMSILFFIGTIFSTRLGIYKIYFILAFPIKYLDNKRFYLVHYHKLELICVNIQYLYLKRL